VGRGCGDGKGALILIGVIIVVIVVVVIVECASRSWSRKTSYFLTLRHDGEVASFPLGKGLNRLNVPRTMVQAVAEGTASATVVASGRENGAIVFVPRLAGDEMTGW
jgi:hypothetical protein